MTPDVWLRSDYQHNIALGEVHLVRASKEQHDVDFVPLYDSETVDRLRAELAEVNADRDATRLERDALQEEIVGWKADQKENLKNQCDLAAECNALRAFAQDVISAELRNFRVRPTVASCAEKHHLIRWDIDTDIYIETPLLTGEGQT